VAVAAVVVAVAAWLERPATAVVPGVNGKIAVASDQKGNYEIHVINADGTGQTDISNDAVRDFDKDWG
jgi:hypothetical protein